MYIAPRRLLEPVYPSPTMSHMVPSSSAHAVTSSSAVIALSGSDRAAVFTRSNAEPRRLRHSSSLAGCSSM
uniref:Uncharacterized protein n=1 Tax=uncultured marine virus TaxID=186617 RepID=A0A0F7L684_9VIRU|nr:hypothetical protein [uncultured marine virus]